MKKNVFTVSNLSVMNFCRNKARRRKIACLSLFGMLVAGSLPVFAAPTAVFDNSLGGAAFNYAKGASFTQVDANNASFSATANSALIDWQKLNIGSGQTLGFTGNQFFNVVSGGDASKIAGTLNANGSVWVFNPASSPVRWRRNTAGPSLPSIPPSRTKQASSAPTFCRSSPR